MTVLRKNFPTKTAMYTLNLPTPNGQIEQGIAGSADNIKE